MPERTDQPDPQPTPQPTPQACTGCSGAGGRVVDTGDGGVTRKHWVTCRACSGTGKRGGGA
jgi:DnaJ-class molecular chaperone